MSFVFLEIILIKLTINEELEAEFTKFECVYIYRLVCPFCVLCVLDIILVKLTINQELEAKCTKFECVYIYRLVCPFCVLCVLDIILVKLTINQVENRVSILSVIFPLCTHVVTVCDTLVTFLDIWLDYILISLFWSVISVTLLRYFCPSVIVSGRG